MLTMARKNEPTSRDRPSRSSRAFICCSAQLKSPAEGLRKSHQTSLPPHAVFNSTTGLWWWRCISWPKPYSGPIIFSLAPQPVRKGPAFSPCDRPGHTTVTSSMVFKWGMGNPVPLCIGLARNDVDRDGISEETGSQQNHHGLMLKREGPQML